MLGQSVNLAEVRACASNELVAVFPFTQDDEICSVWADKIEPYSTNVAQILRSGKTVIMDFLMAAPHRRGYGGPSFHQVAAALAAENFTHAITEVQWLRQLLFWTRHGWGAIAVSLTSAAEKQRTVMGALREGQDPQTLLHPGETFFWHQEPYYECPRWNVALTAPVYLASVLTTAGASNLPGTETSNAQDPAGVQS